jgi:hypothetical protein
VLSVTLTHKISQLNALFFISSQGIRKILCFSLIVLSLVHSR